MTSYSGNQSQIEQRHIQRMEMCDIVKRFPGVLANDRVCMDVNAGEVACFLGGKWRGQKHLNAPTYMACTGLTKARSSSMARPHVFHSPADAIRSRDWDDPPALYAGANA